MLKVCKFGGSSLSDAKHFKQVKAIIEADKDRKCVIVSAPGKGEGERDKITDLLYLCFQHNKYHVEFDSLFARVEQRYLTIKKELNIDYPIENDIKDIKDALKAGEMTEAKLVSRGEYLCAKLLSAYLGYSFLDAKDLIHFKFDGKVDEKKTNEDITKAFSKVEKAKLTMYINEKTGDLDYTKVLTASGRREPNWTGSVSNTFTYKQLRLSTTLLYNLGAKTRLFRMFDSMANASKGFKAEDNVNRDLLNRWQKPGDEKHTNIPSILGQGSEGYYYYTSHWSAGYPYTGATIGDNAWTMYDYSTARVVSANYLKLSNISLTYELNQKQLSRIGLGRLAFTLSASNLYTWCDSALRGQTPSQGGFTEVQLGDTPNYTMSININF